MSEILALAGKDLRLLIRDKSGFFFTFIFPLIYCIFFGTVFKSMSEKGTNAIKVVVVDEDDTSSSRDFVARLEGLEDLDVTQQDAATARDLVRSGRRAAYIRLGSGFGDRYDAMFGGDPPVVEIGLDPSRRAEAGMLRGLLTGAAFEGVSDIMTDPEKLDQRTQEWLAGIRSDESINPVARGALELFLPSLSMFSRQMARADDAGGEADGAVGMAFEPIRIDEVTVGAESRDGPTNAYGISFPQGIVWGVMGCAAGFGISLVTERSNGTLIRLRMSPIGAWHVLGGKAVACFGTIVMLMLVLLVVGRLVFEVVPSSWVMLVAAILSTAAGFVGIMMFLSVLGRTEQSAGGIGWGILSAMAMLGGGMLPLAFMPGWLQRLSHLSPVKWSILAMEGAIWRGFSASEMVLPCAVLVGVGVVFFILGARLFSWTTA